MHGLLRQLSRNLSHVRHVSHRLIMQECCVHHVEFGVQNGDEFQRKFATQYNFTLCGTRFLSNLKQWVLKSQTATVLVTQQFSREQLSGDPYVVPWDQNIPNSMQRHFDSVFNVALKVKDVHKCVDTLTRSGVTVLKEPQKVEDKFGSVNIAVVKSCVGNVVHTLVQTDDYSGVFLPGFDTLKPAENTVTPLVSHFDHVAFVLERGQSSQVLDWYSRCFGMRRFLIHK